MAVELLRMCTREQEVHNRQKRPILRSYSHSLSARLCEEIEEIFYVCFFRVSEALIFGAAMVGQALAFAPNFNSAKLSAGRIFRILDRHPEILSDPVAHHNNNAQITGNISYRGVEFRYPTRPEVQVLRGLNLEIEAAKTVALVGFSGCGKSTVIQLLQRLYDPESGHVVSHFFALFRGVATAFRIP